jgi:hypothetical protein
MFVRLTMLVLGEDQTLSDWCPGFKAGTVLGYGLVLSCLVSSRLVSSRLVSSRLVLSCRQSRLLWVMTEALPGRDMPPFHFSSNLLRLGSSRNAASYADSLQLTACSN